MGSSGAVGEVMERCVSEGSDESMRARVERLSMLGGKRSVRRRRDAESGERVRSVRDCGVRVGRAR